MINIYLLWDNALDYIDKNLNNPMVFETYFRSIEPVYATDNSIVLKSEYNKFIERYYDVLIVKSLRHVSDGKISHVTYINDDSEFKNYEMEQNTKNSSQFTNVILNPKYTFDTFVVGENNRLAHAASLAVSKAPGRKYNPLFIYGGAGLGKTHLLQAIAQYILKENRNMRVAFVTSEQFTNDFIYAISNKSNMEFRERYRQVDVLLIDDIQFMANKEGTQEEFFHTFNDLYTQGKQVILTADKSPKEIKGIEERLITRFESGLTCDITPPNYETRVAILKKKAEAEQLELNNDMVDFVAENMGSNIRELEGVLSKIKVLSDLNEGPITVDILKENLKDFLTEKERHISVENIIQCVAKHFGVTYSDILSSKRTMNIANARQVAMYLTREMTDLSLPAIGEYFGGRNHSTVIHAYNKIKDEEYNDASFKHELNKITNSIKDETILN